MSGWVPFPAEAWPVIVAAGMPKPWTTEAAAFDLRWQVDQRGATFSRAVLRERWGWTDWRVRALLADVHRWWDPGKGNPPTVIQPTSNGHPADLQRTSNGEQENLENPAESSSRPPTVIQPTSNGHPADLHRRVDTPSPSLSPSQDNPAIVGPAEPALLFETPKRVDVDYERAAAFAGQVLNLALGKRASNGPAKNTGLGKKLLAAVRRDAEEILDAMRFIAESEHPTAVFCREHGHGLETALRKAAEYAEHYRNPATGPPGRTRRGEHPEIEGASPSSERLAEILRENPDWS